MKVFSTYSMKIKHYNHIFKETVSLYQAAVDFLIGVCLESGIPYRFLTAFHAATVWNSCVTKLRITRM